MEAIVLHLKHMRGLQGIPLVYVVKQHVKMVHIFWNKILI